jgi:heavy metal sensor kinase
MFLRSIRWQLQLWHGMILFLVLSGLSYTAFELHRTREQRRTDQQLQERMSILLGVLRPPGLRGPFGDGVRRREVWRGEGGTNAAPDPLRLDRPRAERGRPEIPGPERGGPLREFLDLEQREPVFPEFGDGPVYHAVWRRDGRAIRTDNAPPDLPRPEPRSPGVRRRGEYRELVSFAPRGEAIVVGRSIREQGRELRKFAWLLGGAASGILVLGLAGGWWAASRAIKPIDKISEAALKIAGGDLSSRIAHHETESELGRLAAVLNSTFERLDAAFHEQARFTIDVSHELRTPVAVVLSQAQMALNRERPASEYKETIEACQRAAQRMRRMIEALLQLARLDAGQETMQRLPFDLAAAARESAEMLAPLAAERGLKLETSLAPANCMGDSERVGQVITNLISNAIHYSKAGGEIRVSTELQGGMAVCRVADNGIGIPAEDLPHIFDRFYRVDKSRSREKGGTGLGLAISRAIVNAHSGAIEVESTPGQGSTFILRLPR